MYILYSIIISFLVSWIICEIITLMCEGLHNYIKGNGKLLLEKELLDCEMNISCDYIISLNNRSDLHGNYIAKTGTSILFPYYFSSKNNIDYGILIFSEEYFMVKNKFKELRRFSNTNKRYKFKKI